MKTDLFVMEAKETPKIFFTNKVKIYDDNGRERCCFKVRDGQLVIMPSSKGLKPYRGLVRFQPDDNDETETWIPAVFIPEGYQYEIIVS